MDTEPIITREERDALLDELAGQFSATVAEIKAGRHLDGSDAAEITLSIAFAALGAIVGGPAGVIVATLAPMVTDAVVSAAEVAEARARTEGRLVERIAETREDIARHQEAIVALETTEEVEFFEKVRISLRASRIVALERKIARLESYRIPAAE